MALEGEVLIKQIRMLRYQTIDNEGRPVILRAPGHYMPEIEHHLFSPQLFFETGEIGGELIVRSDHAILSVENGGHKITIPIDPISHHFYLHCFTALSGTGS